MSISASILNSVHCLNHCSRFKFSMSRYQHLCTDFKVILMKSSGCDSIRQSGSWQAVPTTKPSVSGACVSWPAQIKTEGPTKVEQNPSSKRKGVHLCSKATRIPSMTLLGVLELKPTVCHRDCLHRSYFVFIIFGTALLAVANSGGHFFPLVSRGSFDSTVRLWDVDAGTCLYTFERHTQEIFSLAFSPLDGDFLATASNDSTLCLWRVKVR
jgi:WD40 repeat protein